MSEPYRLGKMVIMAPNKYFHISMEDRGKIHTFAPRRQALGFEGVSFSPSVKKCVYGLAGKANLPGTEMVWYVYTPSTPTKGQRIDEYKDENLDEVRTKTQVKCKLVGKIKVMRPLLGGGPAPVVQAAIARYIKLYPWFDPDSYTPSKHCRWEWIKRRIGNGGTTVGRKHYKRLSDIMGDFFEEVGIFGKEQWAPSKKEIREQYPHLLDKEIEALRQRIIRFFKGGGFGA